MTSKEGANDKRVKNKRLYKEFELRKNFLKMFVFCFTKPFLYGIIHS